MDKTVSKKRTSKKRIIQTQDTPVSGGHTSRSKLESLGIKLNPNTARQAVILSEIIGKPVSKRKKHI